ncbi:MAG: carboxypeptidase-like regulatory domain-containing protein [Chryseobacterium sp.]|jgi:hypothetical protein|uniref:carboxypeptidase-like regulatory domain-containing protein n=1 Tax=Chryseobacterium sp. TaxID=1871047 RepID=UPI002817AEC4|nr:carboxypeptidase-like regulatory domain-containing protein [Chryseobacterium sp.]MDR2237886.1 carboxypeptidase-like regulatory domain-containing protein [Chryseobacterium sp.]
MKTIFTASLLLIVSLIQAQIITGRILSEDKRPVPYARIGVDQENLGAIADEAGNYSIDLTQADKNKMITIQMGGYVNFNQKIADFIQAKNHDILLREKITELQAVAVIPKKYTAKNWGTRAKTKKVLFGYNPARTKEDQSKELAVLFNNSKKVKLQKINLNIVDIKTDQPILLNFNVYSKDDKLPGQSIISEKLSVELTKEQIVDNTFTFDVSDKNIWIDKQDFFVSMQVMNGFDGWIYLSGALLKSIYHRKFYSPWTKTTIAGPALNIDVKVEK